MLSILARWNVANIIITSGWVGRIIILILFIISVISVAIFIAKLREFKSIGAQNDAFIRYFRAKTSLEEFSGISSRFSGPLCRIFESAYASFKKCASNPNVPGAKLAVISSTLEQAKLKESQKLSGRLAFIATAVTISPFLGLLGTVWGIMNAFMDIRTYGSAHINIVAPGIAEALITTVAGLCVAIPCVVFYNYLTNRAGKLIDEVELFAKELVDELKIMVSE